jgi:hypothetical protein
MTLLEETIKELKEHGKTEKDVLWCGSPEFGYFTWDEFKELADVEYLRIFSPQTIADDLLIVGKDFWLERYFCNDFECWDYKTIPEKPQKHVKPKTLFSYELEEDAPTLQMINRD